MHTFDQFNYSLDSMDYMAGHPQIAVGNGTQFHVETPKYNYLNLLGETHRVFLDNLFPISLSPTHYIS